MTNLVTSYQENLSNEAASQELTDWGFKNVELTIELMGHTFKGSGHRNLFVQISKGRETISLERVTTDMTLTDAWGDDEETFEGAMYESQDEVMKSAFSYILGLYENRKKLDEFLNP